MKLNVIRRLMPNWGTTYGPPGDGPFPSILLLHGSEGGMSGWTHRTAAIFAASGFLCYPHTYSKGGNAWNAGNIREVELTRTAVALEALRGFGPSNGKVGIYGVSRGAEHALLLASLMSRDNMHGLPDAVACLAAPDVVCGVFDARHHRDTGDPGWQAWDPSQRAWLWKGSSEDLLPTTPIEVEYYKGPLFLSVGLKDQVWSSDMTRRLEARRSNLNLPVEAHYFENEGHLPGSEAENQLHSRLISFFAGALVAPV